MQNMNRDGATASAHLVVQRAVPAYVLALFDIAQFSAVLQPMIQQGYLETEFDDYLEAQNGYWVNAEMDNFTERFEKHRGTTITRTRPGLKAPMQVPVNPTSAQTAPTDGVNPSSFAVEQYTFTPFELSDGDEIDLIGTNFAIVDRFKHMVKVNNTQGVQSCDLLARDTYTAGYAVGATFATSVQGTTGANRTVLVDDTRGLDTVIVNGQVVPVSPSNPLPAMIYPGGVRANGYAVSINGATPAGTNISSYAFVAAGTPGTPAATRGNGTSGTISFVNLPNAIAIGDIIVAGDAPYQIVGVANKLHYSQMSASSGDGNLTSAMLIAARGYLENNAVPFAKNRNNEDEGTYCWYGASNVMMSLYNDPDFKQANQTLGQSKIYQNGRISQYLGMTFLTNTNAPKVPLPGGGYAYLSIVSGFGAIRDEWYEGLLDWANNDLNPAYVTLRAGIAQIMMPAYADVQGRRARVSWLTIRDMICPTDVTRSSVVLTGSGSRRTRAIAVWTYGAI
jgi:hypothetical protein